MFIVLRSSQITNNYPENISKVCLAEAERHSAEAERSPAGHSRGCRPFNGTSYFITGSTQTNPDWLWEPAEAEHIRLQQGLQALQ